MSATTAESYSGLLQVPTLSHRSPPTPISACGYAASSSSFQQASSTAASSTRCGGGGSSSASLARARTSHDLRRTLSAYNGSVSFVNHAASPGSHAELRTHKDVHDDLRKSYWHRTYGARNKDRFRTTTSELFVDLSDRKDALKVPATLAENKRKNDFAYAATVGKVRGNFEESSATATYRPLSEADRRAARSLPVFMGWHAHALSS
eukprot:TRINITY_DN15569_c0_g1_i3.p1 TRINITY_DN15569_c0_g1~~TRINITY_DN15569_c0_g1_i3.p1  ORF type:complete len:207 (-),score=27.19 TRINITY_DN15569_c0_g1_i3:77-697(-)